MTTFWQQGANSSTIASSTTSFCMCANGAAVTQATEILAQAPIRSAGTFSNLSWTSLTNATSGAGGASTITFRIGGTNGNESISITSGATGIFTDTVDTDLVAAGNLCNTEIVVGTGGNLSQTDQSVNFSSNFIKYGTSIPSAYNVASTTYYLPIVGNLSSPQTAEGGCPVTFRGTGTLEFLSFNASTNTRTTPSTLASRINGTAGNLSVSITASTTGQFEDTGDRDQISPGNTVDLTLLTGTGTGSLAGWAAPSFATQGPYPMAVSLFASSGAGTSVASGVTDYTKLNGNIVFRPNTGSFGCEFRFATTTSYLFTYIATSAGSTGNATFTMYKGASAGHGSISKAAGTTGYFEDTVDTDTFLATDTANIQVDNGTNGAITFNYMGVHVAPSNSGHSLLMMGVGS